ncbi:hypothetical protein FisN_3Lh443 [Fistulifera solaris]|uniref:DUF1499 domain-containing protein n=1 Tax=Fistulifera solaris TaxID=1519565 RepID=A0A1Z5J8L3_FISSO|nr:hypothetical protein FisN_3Lh443 [Fistulifera solaris]|eukprot:GAX10242.1 hypothetical protein FisN_3Lh443 [Fistulifera solaris]
MKLFLSLILFVTSATSSEAFGVSSSRRELFQQTAFGTAAFFLTPAAHAIEACPKGSKNCIVTVWSPPEGTTKKNMALAIRSAIYGYPKNGQEKVDVGGYEIVQDDLETLGTARVEFKSGVGNFSKFLNGGKPFIDDLTFEINGDHVEVRSASRMGDNDFDVNRKRLVFLANTLRSAGWSVEEPTYYK